MGLKNLRLSGASAGTQVSRSDSEWLFPASKSIFHRYAEVLCARVLSQWNADDQELVAERNLVNRV